MSNGNVIWTGYGKGKNEFQHKIVFIETDSINEFDLRIVYPYSDRNFQYFPFVVFDELSGLNGISEIEIEKTEFDNLVNKLCKSISRRINSSTKSSQVTQDEIKYEDKTNSVNIETNVRKALHNIFKNQ